MTPSQVYAVFQEGVYRHACGGIFSTEAAAIEAAKAIARADRDDYHSYQVVPFFMDEALVEGEEFPGVFECSKGINDES